MNLFQIKNYVMKNLHGTWLNESSQAVLESEIFQAVQNAENDFLWGHPIRLLNDDGEHAGWQKYPTNLLTSINYDALTIVDYGRTPNAIKTYSEWNEALNWVITLNTHEWRATFDYQTETSEASTIGIDLEGLTAGETYTLKFIMGATMSATVTLQPYVDQTEIGSPILPGQAGDLIELEFTAPAATCEIRFYAATLTVSDVLTITNIGVRPTVNETEYALVVRYEDLPFGVTLSDELGFIETLQTDGAADGAGMPLRWATLDHMTGLVRADADNSGGLDDNYYLTFSSPGELKVTVDDSGDVTLYAAGSPVLAQVPDSDKEFPNQMRDSLALYAISVIEQHMDKGKADLFRTQATALWGRIQRMDDIDDKITWEQGASPYAY